MTAPVEAASPHLMNTYARLPIAMARGEGCHVWDVNGKRYLDGLGGIAAGQCLGGNIMLRHRIAWLIGCGSAHARQG